MCVRARGMEKAAAKWRAKKLRLGIPDAQKLVPFRCEHCGIVVTRRKWCDDARRFCSRAHCFAAKRARKIETERAAEAARWRPCLACNKTIRKPRLYCSDRCHYRTRHPIAPRDCMECQIRFVPLKSTGQLLCGRRCLKRHNRRADKTKGAYARAQKYGVAYEPIDVMAVFARDGWRCQICGKRTPEKRRGTCYSNAPELDHRVPMSKGGPHIYSNVQCACRACNGKKSNRSCAGQTQLFPRPGIAA